MILAVILSIAAIAFLCWFLFVLAGLALPVFVAMWVTHGLHGMGVDLFGALLLGLFAGFATFVVGQLLLILTHSPLVRLAIAMLFVVPAGIAGFSAAHSMAAIGTNSELARLLIGLLGAVAVGSSAWVRLTTAGVMADTELPQPRVSPGAPDPVG